MRNLKAFFLRRRPSEKGLLTAFLAIALVIWLNSFWGRASAFASDAKTKMTVLSEQKMWIDKEAQIEKTTAEALTTFKSGPSLNSAALISQLDQIGRRVGLTPNARSGQSKSSPQFTLNSAQVTINAQNSNADWAKILQFYTELQKQRPNITLQTPFQMISAAGGRGGVTATFNVSAVEMKDR